MLTPFSTTSQPCSVAPPSASFPLPRLGSNSAVILLVPSLSVELNRAQPYVVVPRSVASLFLLPYAPLNPCLLSVHSAQSSPQPTSDLNQWLKPISHSPFPSSTPTNHNSTRSLIPQSPTFPPFFDCNRLQTPENSSRSSHPSFSL
ncbi:hypothetical protein M0R45_021532 [Rubus argutus]|uniref:Uncharacterized protein n=1 Tax=Rubus argutus TaxID=59490 RepID=A0AAW1XDW1_RUBAR